MKSETKRLNNRIEVNSLLLLSNLNIQSENKSYHLQFRITINTLSIKPIIEIKNITLLLDT